MASSNDCDYLIIWSDERQHDFDRCQQKFFGNAKFQNLCWQFYNDDDECLRTIRTMNVTRKVILVISGRRVKNHIVELQGFKQIHSIYIYCFKEHLYKSLQNQYSKIRGIFNDPVQLSYQLAEFVYDQIPQDASITIVDPNQMKETKLCQIPFIQGQHLRTFFQPKYFWPMEQPKNQTFVMFEKGQGTFAVSLPSPLPFKLILSNQLDRKVSNQHQEYAIILEMTPAYTRISIMDAKKGRESQVRYHTESKENILQPEHHQAHCYWVSFCSNKRYVRFGIGEIRKNFQIHEETLLEHEESSLRTISFVHFLCRSQSLPYHLEKNFKIFFSTEPIEFDPPSLIISTPEFPTFHRANHIGVMADLLKNPCEKLYEQMKSFVAETPRLSDLLQSIEASLNHEKGWCSLKINEKRFHSVTQTVETVSLRIEVKKTEERTFLYPFIIEIWPKGHHGPVCTRFNTYGIICVLSGQLLMKFYPHPAMTNNPDKIYREQIFSKSQWAWIIPKLNQVYRLSNPDMIGSCCVIAQVFVDEELHRSEQSPSIGDLTTSQKNDGFDIDFLSFKKLIENEANNLH